jgi:hypothetical protein
MERGRQFSRPCLLSEVLRTFRGVLDYWPVTAKVNPEAGFRGMSVSIAKLSIQPSGSLFYPQNWS